MWLERNLSDPLRTTYQKRNYNPKTALALDGLQVNGYTVDGNELQFLVATEAKTNHLIVMSLAVTSSPR